MNDPSGYSHPSPHVPDSVYFIEHKLPHLHAGFMHPTIRYDPAAGQYVAPTAIADPRSAQAIPPRPRPQPAETMKFWAKIFPQAMMRLNATCDEPLDRYSTGYSIRHETDWAGVRRQLDNAQGSYEVPPRSSKYGDTKAFLTRLYRKAADTTDRWKLGTKVAVQVDYISPVVALVDILLDAASVASDVRNKVCTTFKPEEMEEDFETIEFSVGLYVGDVNIENAAVDLVNSIFQAMEDAIGFFLSKRASRARDALILAGDYQKGLIGKLDNLKKHSARLVRQVDLTDKYSTRIGLENVLAAADASSKQLEDSSRAQRLHTNQACARMLNSIEGLLRDGEERAKELVREMFEEFKHDLQDEFTRRATPSPRHSPSASPYILPHSFIPASPYLLPLPQMPQPLQLGSPWLSSPPAQQYYAHTSRSHTPIITSDFLLALLNASTSNESDVRDILSQRSLMFPASVRRSETALLTYEFRRWLTHSSSLCLLIEGDQDSDGSPISAVSLISALVYVATKDRKDHIPLLWSCSLHDDDNDDTDREDGSNGGEGRRAGLTSNKRVGPKNTGPQAVVAGLITHLLQEHTFNFSSMLSEHHMPNLELVARGNIKELCKMLEWLVRRVPKGITLLFLLDDVGHLEGNAVSWNGGEDGLLMLLRTLFRLAADKQLACVIRLLVTSAHLTDEVADLFEAQHGLVVDFGTLDEGDGLEECDIEGFAGSGDEEDSEGD